MALQVPTQDLLGTPRTQAEVRELAEQFNRGQISADEYFAAVERRAERLVEDEVGRR